MPLFFIQGAVKHGCAREHVNTGHRMPGQPQALDRYSRYPLGMGLMKCTLAALAAVAVLDCAAQATRNVDQDLDMSIPENVRQALDDQLARNPLRPRLLQLNKSIASDHKGNFGRITYFESDEFLQVQGDGLLLLGSTESVNTGSTQAKTMAQAMSLCGLFPVLGESSGESSDSITTAVPIGGVFVPFGFTSARKSAMRLKLTKLSTEAALCAPKPGTEFSYSIESELQRKLKGVISSSNKQTTLPENVHCSVAAQGSPATELNPDFQGDYLAVSCRSSGGFSGPHTRRLAYLLAEGMYLDLGRTTEWSTTKTTFKALRYKPD